MYRSQCCAHNNGTRGVVETTFWVPLSRAQHVLPYLLYAWAIQKGRKTDVLHVQNWKTRSLQRALTVSLSKSNSVYEKAAEGVIPAKCMLVRGYSSKGGGQETRFFCKFRAKEDKKLAECPCSSCLCHHLSRTPFTKRPPRASFPQSVRYSADI